MRAKHLASARLTLLNAGAAKGMSVEQMGDAAGVELRDYMHDPDRLSELPIFELRWICQVVGVDWVNVLAA